MTSLDLALRAALRERQSPLDDSDRDAADMSPREALCYHSAVDLWPLCAGEGLALRIIVQTPAPLVAECLQTLGATVRAYFQHGPPLRAVLDAMLSHATGSEHGVEGEPEGCVAGRLL